MAEHSYEEIRKAVDDILAGQETIHYDLDQYANLKAGVAELLSRRGNSSETVEVGDPRLNEHDSDICFQVFQDLKNEGVILEGLNEDNPKYPFFRFKTPSAKKHSVTKRNMKRDKNLLCLLLKQVRDDEPPDELGSYPDQIQLEHAAYLVNEGYVDGRAIPSNSEGYVSVRMNELTEKGHDFLEQMTNMSTPQKATVPPEIQESLKSFRTDHPIPAKAGFIMMRFGSTEAHGQITATVKGTLVNYQLIGLRADDKEYNGNTLENILTYMHGCGFGIAIFERLEQDDFNPNVTLEVGYMLALRKPVLLLKDKTLKNLNADLMGKLYRRFDPQKIAATIPDEILKWLRDYKLIK